MARPIAEADEATKPKDEQVKGVSFVKNHLNEVIVLPNGDTFKFNQPKMTFTDAKFIENLRRVASQFGVIED